MVLADIARSDSRFFIKSEWGPASDYWPAVSFSRQAVGRKMRGTYDPAKDFVIYVGTSNANNTPDPRHRSRLLSVVRMEIRTDYKTRDLIPEESWSKAYDEHGDRWVYAFAMLQAWDLTELPPAREYIPRTYSSLRNPATFGDFVVISPEEREGVLGLQIAEVPLRLQKAARQGATTADFLGSSRSIREMIGSMASRIEERRAASGTTSLRHHPDRVANPPFETEIMLFRKWTAQEGMCGLCHRAIPVPCFKGPLQPSPDRIDSGRPDYSDENVHITHLGCNYAKNQYGLDQFEEWLEVLKGRSAGAADAVDAG